MDRIELAQRRYREVISTWSTESEAVLHRHIEAWLRNDVCPIVAEFVNRPRFREQASWPLDHLRAGADSEVRQAVDSVDRSLVKCAQALVRLASNPLVTRALQERYPPQLAIVGETLEIADGHVKRLQAEQALVDNLAIDTSQVQGIADRFWKDLVCPDDYFEPLGGWMVQDKQKGPQDAEFLVNYNPELLPVGDMITRTLLRRLELLYRTVASFRVKCQSAVRDSKRRYPAQMKDVADEWSQLSFTYNALRAMVLAVPSMPVRESCITLVQAYAAFQPLANLNWLGLRPELIQSMAPYLPSRLRQCRGVEIADRIAVALADLRKLYDGSGPREAEIEEAIGSGGLVLLDRQKKAYWAGTEINTDWKRHKQSWQFLSALAGKSARLSPVGETDLFDGTVANSAMSTAFGRLKQQLPAGLWKYIQPGQESHTYIMDLRGQRAFLFD